MSQSDTLKKQSNEPDKTRFPLTLMKPLEIDPIVEFFKLPGRTPLSPQAITTLTHLLTKDKHYRELNSMLVEFINLMQRLNNYAGLTQEEKSTLIKLQIERETFRATHEKGKFDGPKIKSFIDNEKQIIPYSKTIQWWQTNSDALNKLSLWEELNQLILDKGKENSDTANDIKNKQYQLLDIKTAWSSQHLFTSIPANELSEFYKNFICVLQETLKDEMHEDKNKNAHLNTYLSHLLYLAHSIKQQAINAMLYRLQTVDYYNDITIDDTLNMTIDKIENITHINLRSNGLRPKRRGGLTPDIIKQFRQHILTSAEAETDGLSLKTALNKLNTQTIPEKWQSATKNNKLVARLIQEPAILITGNTFIRELLSLSESANSDKGLISESKLIEVIDKVKQMTRLLSAAKLTYSTTTGKSIKEETNPIAKDLAEYDERYRSLMHKIESNIKISINYQMTNLINATFTANDVFTLSIDDLSTYITKAREFYLTVKNIPYCPDGDVILAISDEIKATFAKGNDLNSQQINSILALIKLFYPNTSVASIEKIRQNIGHLGKRIKNITGESDGYLLHFIAHMIESPLIDENNLPRAIYRHQYIAQQYHEIWLTDKEPLNQETNDPYLSGLIAYIKNVSIKLARMSTSLDLETFDDHISDPMIEKIIAYRDYPSSPNIRQKQANLLNDLHEQYQSEIFKKINNLFSIKTFLFNRTRDRIDLSRLKNSLNASRLFFSTSAYHEKLCRTIQEACHELIKKYLIDCLNSNARPDTTYIDQVSSLLGITLLETLKNDADLTAILDAYQANYDGSTSKYHGLILAILRPESQTLYDYTKNRLDFIKSTKQITQDDYQFFSKINQTYSLKKLFNEYKLYFSKSIDIISKNDKSLWNNKQAVLIELFGSDEATLRYRFKRTRELLSQVAITTLSDSEQSIQIKHFEDSINTQRLYHGKILDTSMTLINQTTLADYMDTAGRQFGWKPVLEKIIALAGSNEQLTSYHAQCITKLLVNHDNINEHWLGMMVTNLKSKEDYLAFLGADNLSGLLPHIESALIKLSLFSDYFESRPISNRDINDFSTLCHTVKPLLNFYLTCGKNENIKAVANRFESIKDKVNLQHALSSSIPDAGHASHLTPLDSLANDMMTSIQKLSNNDLLSSHNIHQFITFCTTRLFPNLTLLYNNKQDLSFNKLMLVNSLLESLSLSSTKLKLIKANKQEIESNPLWLSLINHFDDELTLDKLEAEVASSEPDKLLSKDFLSTLTFSRKLFDIKMRTTQLLREALFQEAGITPIAHASSLSFKKQLNAANLSATQLIHLWVTLLQKMRVEQIPDTHKPIYLSFINEMISAVSHVILSRSQDDQALLKKFMDSLIQIPASFHAPAESMTPNMWSNTPTDLSQDQLPLFAKKAIALSLLHELEAFALKRIKQNLLPEYRKACNDPVFYQQFAEPDSAAPAIRQLFNIKNDIDALTLAHTIQIYHLINQVMVSKGKFSDIATKINLLITHAEQHAKLSSDKSYLDFLKSAHSVATHNPLRRPPASNDATLSNTDTPRNERRHPSPVAVSS